MSTVYLSTTRLFTVRLHLDSNFHRSQEQYGTDIFIIGFKDEPNWKNTIVTKVLESFICAIQYDYLEIVVDDIVINKATLRDLVFDPKLTSKKSVQNSIISQYLLLTDTKNRFEDIIDLHEYGRVILYSMEFKDDYEKYSTSRCTLVRYPYMKIKDSDKISSLPCSALAIIEDNLINSTLRDIENPQHVDWEFNRIEDLSVREEIHNTYKLLLNKIHDTVASHLAVSDNSKTDIEGAGDFLPSIENGKAKIEHSKNAVLDIPKIHKKKVKNKTLNKNASIEDENGDGAIIDIGEESENPEDEESLESENHKKIKVKIQHNGTEDGNVIIDENGHPVLRRAELRGIRYHFFCTDAKSGLYHLVFNSIYTENTVKLEMYSIDDAGGRDSVKIIQCKINGISADILDNHIVHLALKQGEQMNIELETDQTELFSSEVKLYAYR